MRILLLNQTFYPDMAATAQYLSEVASSLADAGHQVTVVTGRRAYDDPERSFSKTEMWRGVRIHRVYSTRFGKRSRWSRAADFASFVVSCCARLVLLPRHDVVLALTTPPLISFIGAWRARIWRVRFCYWVMDFNPDEAIAAGWLEADSFVGRGLDRMSRFSLQRAEQIIALDHFMRERIVAKGISQHKIKVIPPWSQDEDVCFDAEGRRRFRTAHRLEDKFVVMYSGNHSMCHPLDTVMAAAKRLADNEEVAFCFVGGGTQFPRIQEFARHEDLPNVSCFPYQPFSELAGTLSAADLHLVVMGNQFVGLVHPCKLYNILRVGSPLIYVGPTPSHVSEIFDRCRTWPYAQVKHGEVEQLVESILELKRKAIRHEGQCQFPLAGEFSKQSLLPQVTSLLESPALPEPSASGPIGHARLRADAVTRIEPRN